jgi:hypothetical protein
MNKATTIKMTIIKVTIPVHFTSRTKLAVVTNDSTVVGLALVVATGLFSITAELTTVVEGGFDEIVRRLRLDLGAIIDPPI